MGLGILGHIPQRLGAVEADEVFKIVLVAPLAGMHLPAIAAGGAGTDLGGFQHDDRKAALGKGERGAESGVTSADNADIGTLLTGQRRLRSNLVGGGGVVGIGGVAGVF